MHDAGLRPPGAAGRAAARRRPGHRPLGGGPPAATGLGSRRPLAARTDSQPPGPPPSQATLDAKYGWRKDQPDDESYSAIHSSVLSMGDFGRYVVESGVHTFSRYRIGQDYPERGPREPRVIKSRWAEFVASLSDKQKDTLLTSCATRQSTS